MSWPANVVRASVPRTSCTRNRSLICILLKSPVRSCTVTSVTRPMTFDGSSAGVSPITWRLNISGASRLNQPFAFHLSFTLRAEVRVGCFAMGSPPRSRGPYKTFRPFARRPGPRGASPPKLFNNANPIHRPSSGGRDGEEWNPCAGGGGRASGVRSAPRGSVRERAGGLEDDHRGREPERLGGSEPESRHGRREQPGVRVERWD